MSIPLIVTRGYGNGTLVGSIAGVVLRGFDVEAKAWEEVSGISGSYTEDTPIALENFLSYTEVDILGRITVTENRATWAVYYDETAHLYYDFGADYFDGDFTHHFELYFDSSSDNISLGVPWMLANAVDTFTDLNAAAENFLFLTTFKTAGGVYRLDLREKDTVFGTTQDFYECSPDTLYYISIVRDGAVGSFGTVYCHIYSDAARRPADLLDTLVVEVKTVAKKYRYLYAVNSIGGAVHNLCAGYMQNFQFELFGGIWSEAGAGSNSWGEDSPIGPW